MPSRLRLVAMARGDLPVANSRKMRRTTTASASSILRSPRTAHGDRLEKAETEFASLGIRLINASEIAPITELMVPSSERHAPFLYKKE